MTFYINESGRMIIEEFASKEQFLDYISNLIDDCECNGVTEFKAKMEWSNFDEEEYNERYFI